MHIITFSPTRSHHEAGVPAACASNAADSTVQTETVHDSCVEFRGRYDSDHSVSLALCCLKLIKQAKPPMDTRIPSAESSVIGTPKAMDVTTMAKRRRMQLRAAWWTADILDRTYVEAKL